MYGTWCKAHVITEKLTVKIGNNGRQHFVQVCEVYAHSPFAIFLLDRHCVCEPSTDLCVQQALYLRFDGGGFFVGHLAGPLLFGLGARSDVKAMFNYVSADSPKVTY
jgi:hypothetical protein